jgi:hypothetical protein
MEGQPTVADQKAETVLVFVLEVAVGVALEVVIGVAGDTVVAVEEAPEPAVVSKAGLDLCSSVS